MLAEGEADGRDWAEDELGAVALGDARLTSRLVELARSLARAPDASLPQALPKWSELKAAYRFFDNAKAVPEHILSGHIAATRLRTQTVPIVLAVQDTTYLNWEHHPATQGLGRLSDAGRGIICHSTPLRQNSCRLYKTRTWGGDEGSEWQGTQRNSKAER